jgi:threonine-phosphate decarboxylase
LIVVLIGEGSIDMVKKMRKHGGNIEAAAQKYNLEIDEIIDFSANINFLGPPKVVKEEIKDNLDRIIHYPESGARTFSYNLAEYLNINSENLIIGNGAVEIIYLITKVIQAERAMVLAPTFSEYEAAIESAGGEIELFKLDREQGFKLDIDRLVKKLKQVDIDLLFLCNPNNPTGDLVEKEKLKQVLQLAKEENIFVVLDEAFLDFLLEEDEHTLIKEAVKRENLLVLRSMTKFFAIPGLRIGYGITNQQLIAKLKASKDPWNINLFAQKVGIKVLKEADYIQRTKEVLKREKIFLYQQLKEMDYLKPYSPTVNYILIDISDSNYSSQELERELAKRGILIRDCSTYHLLGKDFIRVAVKSRKDNKVLINKLKELL